MRHLEDGVVGHGGAAADPRERVQSAGLLQRPVRMGEEDREAARNATAWGWQEVHKCGGAVAACTNIG